MDDVRFDRLWRRLATVSLVCCIVGFAAPSPATGAEGSDEQAGSETKSESDDSKNEGKGLQVGFVSRAGLTAGAVASDPNFYGGGGVAEATIRFNDLFGAGFRFDGLAMFGFNLGDEVAAGIRAIAGTLLKTEFFFWKGKVNPVLGLGVGRYAVAVTGASVGADKEEVGAIAAGGATFGLAPQVGVDLGPVRIAGLTHLVFAGSRVDPAFALEVSWEAFRFDF